MIRLRFAMLLWAPLILAALALPTFGAIEVGDVVVVKQGTAELRLGTTALATVRAGQELVVKKIEKEWIWTSVERDGKPVNGWILRESVELLRKAAEVPAPPAGNNPAPAPNKTAPNKTAPSPTTGQEPKTTPMPTPGNKTPPAAAATGRDADKEAIRKSARDFAAAFEKGDAKALAAFWTEEGEYYDDDGDVLRGRATIEKAFTGLFKDKPGGKMEIDVQSIRFPSRDTAIEEGVVRVTPGTGHELPTSTWYRILHVREDGRWSIVTSREWGAADHKLEDLGWLIGDWTAKSKDHEFKMSFEWTEKKAQIRNHFTVKKGDTVISTGTQTIAIDPKTGQLRSWMFDDDGGRGHSIWFRDENRWVLDTASVMADGRETLSTNVISRLGEDEVIWRSTNRTIVKSEVPDTQPVKLTRVKATK